MLLWLGHDPRSEPAAESRAIASNDARTRKQLESEERLTLAIEIGELASWDWDMRSGRVAWSDRHFLMQGYAVGEVTPSYEAWLARVHPEDQAATGALIEAAREETTRHRGGQKLRGQPRQRKFVVRLPAA